jgi:hypothetical protein
VLAKDLVERIGHDKSITLLLSVDQQRTTASLEERLIDGDSGHIGIEKRESFMDCEADMRIAMKPGHLAILADTPEGRCWIWSSHFGSSNARWNFGKSPT